MESLPVITPAGEGEQLAFFGEQVTIKISGEKTGGAYAVCEFVAPPGAGAPPHLHEREDEVFLIQSGTLRILANNQWQEVGPGDVVFAPRRQPHAYHNHGPAACRFWLMVSPAGFENFYRELSVDARERTEPDLDALRGICGRHGIRLLE
jgi:quercetin dioxygenase-like cupin family protein